VNVGELFVNISIKGADKSVEALVSIKTGLSKVASMSLEAKAAILAVVYGLEHMMAISDHTGTELLQFSTLTGLSAVELQKWQHAAMEFGVSSEEVSGSLKGLQGIMTTMLTGGGTPRGMGIFAQAVGFDPARARDTFYVMKKLQEFAQTKLVPQDIANQVLKSFGLSDSVIAAMRNNAFNPKALDASPYYGDRETKTLNKTNAAWAKLQKNIEMSIGHLNARHGLKIVEDISKVVPKVLTMVEALIRLSEKLHVFEVIGDIFKGWCYILDFASEGFVKVVDAVGGQMENGKEHTSLTGFLDNLVMSAIDDTTNNGMINRMGKPSSISSVGDKKTTQVTNNHATIYTDTKDGKGLADEFNQFVKGAYYQINPMPGGQ
jgi:hypothetical protein